MHTIGVIAFTDHVLKVISELETALTRTNYPVHIEQMIGKPQSTQLVDFYYEENAILVWLCRCHGDENRCREAVERFIETGVDIIIAMAPTAFEYALKLRADAQIPVIFTHLAKSQYKELTANLNPQAVAVTGVYDIWMEMVDERVSLFTEVVPPPKTVHTFFNPGSSTARVELENLKNACEVLGIELIPHTTRNLDEVKDVLTNLVTRPDHAIFRLSDPMLHPLEGLIGAIAHEHYIPYMGKSQDELEASGSLFALEPEGVGQQAARLVDLILQGVDLAAIPPVEPKSKMLSVNLQAAQNLGLIVSPAVLQKAQVVIPAKERKSLVSRLRNILVPATLIITIIVVAAYYWGVLPLLGLTLLSTTALALSLIIYLIGAIVISAVIYFAYKFYRSRQGINTDLTYKEIPTE